MANCGYCSIIVKQKDSINQLLEILGKNYDEERDSNYFSFLYSGKDFNCYLTSEVVKVEDTDNYIQINTHFRRSDAVCIYLKLKGIDFIYRFSDEQHGMGGLTNDATGEFFKTRLYVMFDELDEVVVDIPIDATQEYIDAKIKEIETERNMESIHWYTYEYCDDSYFDVNDTNRESFEKQIKEMLSGELQC